MMGFSLFSMHHIKRVKYLSKQGLKCKKEVNSAGLAEFYCSLGKKFKTKLPQWLLFSPAPLQCISLALCLCYPLRRLLPLTAAARWRWNPDQVEVCDGNGGVGGGK